MGYLVHILVAIGGQTLVEHGLALPGTRPWLLPLWLVFPHALGLFVRRASLDGKFRRADIAHHALVWCAPVLHVLALSTTGWLATVEAWTGISPRLLEWPHPVQFLAFAPFVAFGLASIDARARLGGSRSETVRHARKFQTRMFLSALAPVAMYVLCSYALGMVPGLRLNVEEVAVWGAVFTAGILTSFFIALPWVLCNTWETVPLAPGIQRSLLEAVAARAGFRCRELLVWRTGNLLANAAIVGMVPRWRYVLFSDSLLSQLSLRELAAVFAHEIGHAKRRHVLIFASWSVVFFLTADLLAVRFASDSDMWTGAILASAILVWYGALGFLSRRFELEADLESLELTGDADALIAALDQVSGAHSRRDSSWRHFSTGDRIRFLQRVEEDPSVAQGFRRRLLAFATLGYVGALLVIGLEVADLVQRWPADRVRVDLRRGDYVAAVERAREHGVDADLALLAQRGASLEPESVDDLVVAARDAMRRGEVEDTAVYLDLALLRGDDTVQPLKDALVLALDGRIEDARSMLASDAPDWREDFEAFLARSP